MSGLPQPIQSGLNFIGNAADAMLNPVSGLPGGSAPELAQTVGQMSPGGLLQNAASDVGQMAGGLASIPSQIWKGITQPQTVAPAVTGALQNIGQNINQMAGQPINPQTGQLQLPNPSTSLQYMYQHPVQTAATVAPLAKGIGLAGEAGAAGEAGTAGAVETAGEAAAKTAGTAAKGNPMWDMSENDPEAVAKYQSIFQIPRNVAQKMSLKPDNVVNQLINDGVTGKTLNELEQTANNVTGENGAFPAINRIMLNDVKTPIDVTQARDAAGFNLNKTSSFDTYLKGSPQGLITTVKNQVQREFPNYGMQSDIPETSGHAVDLFDTTQNLDRLSKMYERKAYSAMGDLTNPEMERASQAISDISSNIKDSLDKAIPPDQYEAYKSDPRVLQQLQRVPQPLAQRWLTNAKQFRDGRSIQAPYVSLQNMIDHTNDAKLSAFTKWTNQMQQQQVPQGEAVAKNIVRGVINPQAAAANLAEKGMGKIFSKFGSQPLGQEDFERQQTSGQSATMQPQQPTGLPSKLARVGAVVKKGLPALGALSATQNMVNETPQNQNGASNIPPSGVGEKNLQHGTSISQPVNIPQSVSDIKTNADGTLPMQDPYKMFGIQQPGQYASQISQLQQTNAGLQKQMADNPYNPTIQKVASEQIAANQSIMSSLQTQEAKAQSLADATSVYKSVTGSYNQTMQDLQNAPADLLSGNKMLSSLRNETSGQYATIAEDLRNLGQLLYGDPNRFFGNMTLSAAMSQIGEAAKLSQFKFWQGLSTQWGGNTNAMPTIPSAGTQSISAPAAPVMGGQTAPQGLPAQLQTKPGYGNML